MYNMLRMPDKLTWKVYCVGAVLLLTVALFSLARFYPTFPGDERALIELQGLQAGWLDTSALVLSRIGDVPVAAGLVLAVIIMLVVLRHRADALIVALSLIPMVVNDGLKRVVERPRPDYLLIGPEPSGFGFPSGHTVYALLFGGLLIYFLGQLVPLPVLRRWIQAGLVVLILAMGASRVYLGVH